MVVRVEASVLEGDQHVVRLQVPKHNLPSNGFYFDLGAAVDPKRDIGTLKNYNRVLGPIYTILLIKIRNPQNNLLSRLLIQQSAGRISWGRL